ncbi:glutamate racemase [Rapidithrix thailandica]|uniref:Glutamate racemase n=1 Tax=Rapidithrix thailandica TaxID=413964 RepID=A0AAW9S7M0_9BACT
MDNRPIGVFDSGLGGLSVWKEIAQLLPEESLVYYADSKYCPYGSKTQASLIELSRSITQFLIKENCKLVVVACNTATAAAITTLRNEFPLPFVGMEPAIKPAALHSQTGHIGVLATENTFKGNHFNTTKTKHASATHVHTQIGHGLVELVEAGQHNTPEAISHLSQLLQPLLGYPIDHLVLGCTHYPFLEGALQGVISKEVKIVNPAPAVARQVQKVLLSENMQCQSPHKPQFLFYTSGEVLHLQAFMQEHLSLDMEGILVKSV